MSLKQDIAAAGATEASAALAGGRVTAREMAAATMERIEARESEIGAWAHLDAALAERRARELDQLRERGRPLGPLHGLPVGVKDIIDTADMPTANGTVVDAGRRPRRDATLVARLRRAGAIVIGKTVTTELAYFTPNGTRNPHDPTRTPGGSSSGSAAAVAAGVVPAAIGTQTNGSVIRPASFCGIVGFKPSFGRIPRTGLLPVSFSLDQVGVFARSVEDAALIAEPMFGADGEDELTPENSGAGLLATTRSKPPLRPILGFVKTPAWDRAEPSTQEAFGELAEALGDAMDVVDLPSPFEQGFDFQRAIMAAEMANGLGGYVDRATDQISQRFQELIAEGRAVSARDYLRAKAARKLMIQGLEAVFERYDAIVTPAAPGEAPQDLDSTGDPVFCTLWSYLGAPSVSLPLMTGPAGMPLGVQLVGAPGNDARLLRTARWLSETIAEGG